MQNIEHLPRRAAGLQRARQGERSPASARSLLLSGDRGRGSVRRNRVVVCPLSPLQKPRVNKRALAPGQEALKFSETGPWRLLSWVTARRATKRGQDHQDSIYRAAAPVMYRNCSCARGAWTGVCEAKPAPPAARSAAFT
jgi:hypothetical protein